MSRSWPRWRGTFQQHFSAMVLALRCSVFVRGTECLIGCTLMAAHPFDEEGLVTWDERGACDYYSAGCDVNLASNAAGVLYDSICDPTIEGCLWASSTGTDGTSGCTCDICFGGSGGLIDGEHYYMMEYPIWTRIQCLIAALEFQGYDMSACVGQVVDSATMLCVDEPYEKSMVGAADCDLSEYNDSGVDFWPSCKWAGETRLAAEMFADGLLATNGTPAPVAGVTSSATSETGVAGSSSTGSPTECLIGCTLMAMHPFDEEGLVTWTARGACDYYSAGCDVNLASNAAGVLYDSICDPTIEGCLWASSTGTDGTSGCTCDICFGGSGGLIDGEHYYMMEYPIWTRIQCLIAALEFQGYDMSACVGQVVDSATMLCVDEPYEKSMVGAADCDLSEYNDSGVDFWPSCKWAGETRLAAEMFADGLLATNGTPAPVAGVTSSATPETAVSDSSIAPSSSSRTTLEPDQVTPIPAVAGVSSSTISDTTEPDSSSIGPSSSLQTTLEPTTAVGSERDETNVTGAEGDEGGGEDGWSAGAVGGLVAVLLLVAGGAGLVCKFRNKIHCQDVKCQCCTRA